MVIIYQKLILLCTYNYVCIRESSLSVSLVHKMWILTSTCVISRATEGLFLQAAVIIDSQNLKGHICLCGDEIISGRTGESTLQHKHKTD